MCLYTTSKYPKVADEDIIVYKIVQYITGVDADDNPVDVPYYKAPFQEFVYEMDTVLETKLAIPHFAWGAEYSIGKGFHSFENESAAIKIMNDMKAHRFFDANAVPMVLKCIIPKGASYYKGTFHQQSSYASNQFKLISV